MSNFVNLKGTVVNVAEIECIYPKVSKRWFSTHFIVVVRNKSGFESPIEVLKSTDDLEKFMINICKILNLKGS